MDGRPRGRGDHSDFLGQRWNGLLVLVSEQPLPGQLFLQLDESQLQGPDAARF